MSRKPPSEGRPATRSERTAATMSTAIGGMIIASLVLLVIADLSISLIRFGDIENSIIMQLGGMIAGFVRAIAGSE